MFGKSKWLLFFSMKDEQFSAVKGQLGPCGDQAIVTSAAALNNFSPEEGATRPVRREGSFRRWKMPGIVSSLCLKWKKSNFE